MEAQSDEGLAGVAGIAKSVKEGTSMDVIEAIESRKSVRAFRPDPVPRDVLTKILEVALRAPSTDNTQPWEFAVVTGPVLADLKKALSEKMGDPYRVPPGHPFPHSDLQATLCGPLQEAGQEGLRGHGHSQRRLGRGEWSGTATWPVSWRHQRG